MSKYSDFIFKQEFTQEHDFNVKHVKEDYTANPKDYLICFTDGTEDEDDGYVQYTVKLPSDPNDKDYIIMMDGNGKAFSYPVLVDRNGKKINNIEENLTCDVNFYNIVLVFNATIDSWVMGGK